MITIPRPPATSHLWHDEPIPMSATHRRIVRPRLSFRPLTVVIRLIVHLLLWLVFGAACLIAGSLAGLTAFMLLALYATLFRPR